MPNTKLLVLPAPPALAEAVSSFLLSDMAQALRGAGLEETRDDERRVLHLIASGFGSSSVVHLSHHPRLAK